MKKSNRLGEERYNNQGCLMKIVEYIDANNIVVEFQDEYKARVHTKYQNFLLNQTINPYFPTVFNVGIIGNKHDIKIKNKITKEYSAWKGVIERCYDNKIKERYPTYQNATCCKEWLLFDNFYEWLHSQPNFDKWYNGKRWAIDKDILVKGNKIYSPETCCLVPQNVNGLFVKKNKNRGELPIGVTRHASGYRATCMNPFINKNEVSSVCHLIEEAFLTYKNRKEDIIKQVAEIEYGQGNITKRCYEAMMSYEVEIDD